MIVTADPKGDFNATSQILRYSALAREVTVPRIPSTTSTHILSNSRQGHHGHSSSTSSSHGRNSPGNGGPSWEDLDAAHAEIQRLTSEIEIFALRLTEETARRKAAEASWRAAEDHMLAVEQEIREECFAETETAVEAERRRWQAAWDAEADQHDEHMDRKVDVVIKAVKAQAKKEREVVRVYEDPDPEVLERVEELERENEELRRRLERAEREVQCKSPVKKQRVLKAKRWEDPDATLKVGGEDE